MKKFIETTAAIKSVAALIFAGLIIVYTVFGGFFGLKGISFGQVWQALGVAAIAACLHWVAFAGAACARLSQGKRMAVFELPLLAVLAAFAYCFGWFPAGNAVNWLIFVALCLFFFGVIAIVFALYFRVTGRRYTEILSAYQRRGEERSR